MTDSHLYFQQIEVGQTWVSPGRTVTQADIVNYAGLSGDYNPIHMDHEFAKTTAFGQPVAHGLLVFAIGTGLGTNYPRVRTMAFLEIREWQFLEPVLIGDTVHLQTTVLAKEEKSRGRRGVVTWQRQIINQAGKVVQQGITVTLVEGRGKGND
jgi:acyl dehydratase